MAKKLLLNKFSNSQCIRKCFTFKQNYEIMGDFYPQIYIYPKKKIAYEIGKYLIYLQINFEFNF